MGLIESLSVDNRKRLEAIATKLRSKLGFKAFEVFPAEVLAEHFNAKIFTPEAIPNVDPEQVKLLSRSDNWSAGIISKKPLLIVHNARHAPVRQQSNLMHEFAHITLQHKMVSYDAKTGLPQRRQQDENEAVYLGGCLQIPRRGLLWAKQKQMKISEVALYFNASEDMIKFRSHVNNIFLSS